MAKNSVMGVACWVAALLLLLGTEPNDAQSSACMNKILECSQMAMDLSQAVTSGGNIAELCSTMLQNLTQCVGTVKTLCGDIQMANNLQSTVNTIRDNTCSNDSICAMKAAGCASNMSDLAGSASVPSASSLGQACPMMYEVLNCLGSLGSDCQNVEVVRNFRSSLMNSAQYCDQLTNGGACMDALACYSALITAESSVSCSTIISMLTCLKEKAQSDSCTLNETQISFANVTDLMSDMCPVADKDCPAANECMTPPVLPSSQGGSVMANLADPAFYCGFMSNAAECYVSKAQACGYSPEYVESMRDRHKNIQKQCSGAAAGMCAQKAMQCAGNWTVDLNLANPHSASVLQQICPALPGILNCLKAADKDCSNTEAMRDKIDHFTKFSAYCGQLTNGGACMDAIPCILPMLTSDDGRTFCSSMKTMLTCLKEKAQSRSCTLNESRITIAKVADLMSDLCPAVKSDCAAVTNCMTPPELPTVQEGPQADSLTDPAFYCRYMSKVTECSASNAQTCGYTAEYADSMRDRQENIKEQCLGPSGSATRMVPGVSCCVTVILTMLMAVRLLL